MGEKGRAEVSCCCTSLTSSSMRTRHKRFAVATADVLPEIMIFDSGSAIPKGARKADIVGAVIVALLAS